jgi:hypothetical protein
MYLLCHVPVDKPRWVVELCVPYDWLLGGYLMTRVRTWGAVRRGDTSPSEGRDGD